MERTTRASSNDLALRLLQNGLTVEEMRAASPLEDYAQKLIDKAVVDVGLQRLVIAGDIISAGLTFPLSDPLSVMEVQWERQSKTGGAQRTMNPHARGENQLPDRSVRSIPIYLTTDDFNLGIRTLKMSERVGTPLDTTLVTQATRRVNEAIEDATINGAGIMLNTTYSGGALVDATPGLLTAPNAAQYQLTTDWTANTIGTTGPAMVTDIQAMISILQSKFFYGPYYLYVNTKTGVNLGGDFKVNTTTTIMERLQAIPGLNSIKVADQMPAGPTGPQLALLQMTSDVVDMITGQSPTVIPWTSNDGFVLFWLVMAIMVPRFKDNYDGNSGIVIGYR